MLCMAYSVYILQSARDGSYYVGCTQDIEQRLQRHNQGRSQYTKTKRPWTLVYCEEHPDRSSALKRERQIKSWRRSDMIEALVSTLYIEYAVGYTSTDNTEKNKLSDYQKKKPPVKKIVILNTNPINRRSL